MLIDASALTAMIAGEADAAALLARLERGRIRLTTPLALWETAVAVARILGLSIKESGRAVSEFVEIMKIDMVAVPATAGLLALETFDRYGKGRHPARLNMGDCFAYASARHYGQPLMYKGSDFARTDIEAG